MWELTAHLSFRLDSHNFPIFHHDLLDWFVQHVRPTIDGTQPEIETMRYLKKTKKTSPKTISSVILQSLVLFAVIFLLVC